MDATDRELRMAAWNVIFVDHYQVPFAGFYQNPRKPRIMFKEALEYLLRSTTLTVHHCTGSPHESAAGLAWALWPLGGKCSQGVTAVSFEELHGNMMSPILPGRYYLVRHCGICCNIRELLGDPMEAFSCGHVKRVCIHALYGSQPACFHEFRADPTLRQPRHSPEASEIMIKLRLREPKSSELVKDHIIKLSPRKPKPSQSVLDHDPFDARIVVPLPRIAECQPHNSIFPRPHKLPLYARCAVSGHNVYWKPGFAPGLERYHILSRETLATITQGPGQIVNNIAPYKPEDSDIILLSHLYDFWKAGLLAIHPDTLRVRCFVPSDVIRDYDDKAASFTEPGTPDLLALRIHYEICVWVNMTAFLPRISLTLSSTTSNESMFHGVVEPSIKKMQALHAGEVVPTCEEYCTQKCLLGLLHGDLMDEACPNYIRHAVGFRTVNELSHPLDDQSFMFLIQKQLEIDQNLFCRQPHVLIKGHHAEFFKITLAGFGYTFCAKGVAVSDQHRLMNEYIMYQKMNDIQGVCVPVCLGLFALQCPFGSQNISGLEITHMLLMSHAGASVEGGNTKNDSCQIPSDETLELESERTKKDIRRTGVDRYDNRKKHLYWNSERNRVFYIDFEKNSLVTGTEDDHANGSHSEEVRTRVPKYSQGSEPDWDGI